MKVECFAQKHNILTRPGIEPSPLFSDFSAPTFISYQLSNYQHKNLYSLHVLFHLNSPMFHDQESS